MSGGEKIIHATPKSERPERSPQDWSPAEAQQIGSITAEESQLIRARQDARSRVMGLILAGMCLLFFAITLVKIGLLS